MVSEITTVIFDAGGVLHDSEGNTNEIISRELGLTGALLRRVQAEYMPLLTVGAVDERGFFDLLRTSLGTRPVAESEHLLSTTYAATLRHNEGTLVIARTLGQHGIARAILSNTYEDHAKVWREYYRQQGFLKQFLSHELGLKKPDAAIYQHVLQALGVRPEQTAFVDDRIENVQIARHLGMVGLLFTTPRQLAADLQSHFPHIPLVLDGSLG